jgi:hypothetical protein
MTKAILMLSVASLAFTAGCSTATTTNTAANKPVAANGSTAPSNAAAASATPGDSKGGVPFPEVARISLADAKQAYDANDAVFIDTHAESQYAREHVTGAINIPSHRLEELVNKIPKGKKIIAYCS